MKYLWIFMLVIPYCIWSFFSIKELKEKLKDYFKHGLYIYLSDSTEFWVILNIIALFIIGLASLAMYIGIE